MLVNEWTQSVVVLTVFFSSLPARANLWWPCSNECARCRRQTMPLEELLTQYYPGLFSPAPPSHSVPGVVGRHRFGTPTMYSRVAQIHTAGQQWLHHNSRSPGTQRVRHRPNTSTTNLARGNDLHNNNNNNNSSSSNNNNNNNSNGDSSSNNNKNKLTGNETDVRPRRFYDYRRNNPPKASIIWSGASRAAAVRHFQNSPTVPRCCETVQEYVTPPNVTVEGRVYRVVHLRQAFQFIPVAKCRQGTTCSHGECVERYRAHWVLVYNTTKTHGQPPVSFTPVEVPSHCECLNVGTN